MTLSHDPVHSPIAEIKFVVLSAVRAVGDGRNYRVYSSYSWEQYGQAEWACEYDISTGETFARRVKSSDEVGLLFPARKPAESQPKVPQVIVLDYERDQQVVGIPSLCNAAYLK